MYILSARKRQPPSEPSMSQPRATGHGDKCNSNKIAGTLGISEGDPGHQGNRCRWKDGAGRQVPHALTGRTRLGSSHCPQVRDGVSVRRSRSLHFRGWHHPSDTVCSRHRGTSRRSWWKQKGEGCLQEDDLEGDEGSFWNVLSTVGAWVAHVY